MIHLLTSLILSSHASTPPGYLPKAPQFADPRACGAVDFRAQLGPKRTMGDNGYCFAYSSAVLISQRTGVDVSALDLATGFYLGSPRALRRSLSTPLRHELGEEFLAKLPRETSREGVDVSGSVPIFPYLEGGFEPSTIVYANLRGLCEDKHFPSQDGSDAYAKVIRQFLTDARHRRLEPGPEVDDVPARFRSSLADRFHTAWLRWVAQRCHSRPSPVALMPVDFALAETSREFASARREGRILADAQSQVFAALDFALDHGRAAAIGFDLNTIQVHAGYVEEDGDHSVAIVARRPAAGGCQYLVRDSAGSPCSDFDPAIRPRCRQDEYWVTERELARSIYSVVYIR